MALHAIDAKPGVGFYENFPDFWRSITFVTIDIYRHDVFAEFSRLDLAIRWRRFLTVLVIGAVWNVQHRAEGPDRVFRFQLINQLQ